MLIVISESLQLYLEQGKKKRSPLLGEASAKSLLKAALPHPPPRCWFIRYERIRALQDEAF